MWNSWRRCLLRCVDPGSLDKRQRSLLIRRLYSMNITQNIHQSTTVSSLSTIQGGIIKELRDVDFKQFVQIIQFFDDIAMIK